MLQLVKRVRESSAGRSRYELVEAVYVLPPRTRPGDALSQRRACAINTLVSGNDRLEWKRTSVSRRTHYVAKKACEIREPIDLRLVPRNAADVRRTRKQKREILIREHAMSGRSACRGSMSAMSDNDSHRVAPRTGTPLRRRRRSNRLCGTYSAPRPSRLSKCRTRHAVPWNRMRSPGKAGRCT